MNEILPFELPHIDGCDAGTLTSSRTGWSRSHESGTSRPLNPSSQRGPSKSPVQEVIGGQCESNNWLESVPEAWPLQREAVGEILIQAKIRGIPLTGVEIQESGGWWKCPPADLLPRVESGCSAWVTQRPRCGGLLTTVTFTNTFGRCGAWLVDRLPGEVEIPTWRTLLMEALVLGWLRDERKTA